MTQADNDPDAGGQSKEIQTDSEQGERGIHDTPPNKNVEHKRDTPSEMGPRAVKKFFGCAGLGPPIAGSGLYQVCVIEVTAMESNSG